MTSHINSQGERAEIQDCQINGTGPMVRVLSIFDDGPRPQKAPMLLDQGTEKWLLENSALNQAMKRDIQLHECAEIWYTVDGWPVNYSVDDGNTYQTFKGETPMEALLLCFSEIRNKRGRT